MPLTKNEKQQFIDQYSERLARSNAVVIVRQNGLTVAEITNMRKGLRDVDALFQITKNTLFKIALEKSQFPVPEELFKGTVGVAYFMGNVNASSKKLNDIVKDQKKLELLGALLPGEVLDADSAKSLVELPTREQSLARLLGTLQGPMTSLAGVLQAPLREIITVLYARSEQEQEQEQEAA